ncbi:MAG: ribonuclease E/G [Bacteroidetes bacterium CG2_30_33_31]|nr:MAG: ribonuclease E/G [Bacteroidetes bacterium CG2_30_33_31]
MNKDFIIDVNSQNVTIALLEDKMLIELHKEKHDSKFSVGDIHLGKVKKIIPGLNAAFVDVGYTKEAFLHYLDLGPQVRSLNKYVKLTSFSKNKRIPFDKFRCEEDIDKAGKISDVLSVNMPVLVQIAKEPISSKGPRITSEISFAGRYIVVVPFSNRITVSQKIKDLEERTRLKRLVKSIRPENFGIIVRTNAENKKVADLLKDLNDLMSKWNGIFDKLPDLNPPSVVFRELDRTSTILRDLLNESFNSLVVNDEEMFEDLRAYVKSIDSSKIDLVKLYKGKTPILENYGISRQIKSSFGKKVNMESGAYLIIEHTEAMHVIDVNSGQRLRKDSNQESSAMETNMVSAQEIARQLVLRDMGGIIVIDFIDMINKENRRLLYEKMKDVMKSDRAKHSILPPSKFGLIQITRQRVRPEMEIEVQEQCPMCGGSGESKPPILVIDDIENNIRFLILEQNELSLTLKVHPFVHAYLTKGLFSYVWKWYKSYKKRIKILADPSYHFLEFHFFNADQDEIKF